MPLPELVSLFKQEGALIWTDDDHTGAVIRVKHKQLQILLWTCNFCTYYRNYFKVALNF